MKNRLLGIYTVLKTKLFTASIFFTLAVVLLGGITYLELPCPVCDGTGIVTGAGNLKLAEIDYDITEREVVSLECGYDLERYVYNVKLTVENPTTSPSSGAVKLTFHDPEATRTREVEVVDDEENIVTDLGPIISVQTVYIPEVAAGAERTVEESIEFISVTLEIFDVEFHHIEFYVVDEFICPFHDETSSKVSLTEWLRLR